MGRLDGKTAIITGATSGMGRAAAELFAKEGAKVVAVGTREERLQAIRELGNPSIVAVKANVAKTEDWEKIVQTAKTHFGKIDILVNNAGLSLGPHGVMDTTEEEWNRIMDVDLKGCWLGMKAVIPEMISQGGGSIINTSSTGGLMGGIADGGSAAYAAAKGGVRILSKHAANEFGKQNIRVNSVHPGTTNTGGSGGNFSQEEIEAFGRMLAAETPLAMVMAEPIDIAYMYLYLASDESRFVTGAEFVIDGGLTSH